MARTNWKQVDPQLYNLNDVTSVERAVSVELETGLRVQVLRIVPLAPIDRTTADSFEQIVKNALEQNETWSKALVAVTDLYTYAAIIHEE